MIRATGILLRFGLTPGLILIQIRLWSWGHAGILLDDGDSIDASALHNKVIKHRHKKPPWYIWEKVLPLDHLDPAAQERISARARSTIGDEYDWRAAKGHALGRPENDPRRFICYEAAAYACCEEIPFDKPNHELTPWGILRGWRKSRKKVSEAEG